MDMIMIDDDDILIIIIIAHDCHYYTNLGAFILEHVSEIIADICNNNYTNISCPPLSHLHVIK